MSGRWHGWRGRWRLPGGEGDAPVQAGRRGRGRWRGALWRRRGVEGVARGRGILQKVQKAAQEGRRQHAARLGQGGGVLAAGEAGQQPPYLLQAEGRAGAL